MSKREGKLKKSREEAMANLPFSTPSEYHWSLRFELSELGIATRQRLDPEILIWLERQTRYNHAAT
jgi:hypothetical protein